MFSSNLLLLFLVPRAVRKRNSERPGGLIVPVEFPVDPGDEKAGFDIVSIKVKGELIQKFTASVSFIQHIAAFNGPEEDYLLLQTSIRSDVCVVISPAPLPRLISR